MTDEHGRLEAAAALLSQSGPEEPWMAGAAQMHQLFLVRYPALDGPGARDAEGSGGHEWVMRDQIYPKRNADTSGS